MTQHEATIVWRDSAEGLAALPELSGIEFMSRIAGGELPGAPMASHFAMDVVEVGPGTVTFRCRPDESHYNPIGTVHGGLICTLLGSALGCATHTTLPAGTGYTSIEIKVNFLRPVTIDSGPLLCKGRVTKPGRRVAFAEGEVIDSHGKVVASASGSLLIFELQKG